MLDLQAFYEGIEAWRDTPFRWKNANCCHFVADMIRRTTGRVIDIPAVASEADMREWLAAHGHRSLYHAAKTHLGRGHKPLLAKRGDILWRGSDGALGVCDRQGLFLGDHGLVQVRLSHCTRAFTP
jgi:hypothetical protein